MQKLEIRNGRRVVELTHLDRVFWPESRVTKRDLVDYADVKMNGHGQQIVSVYSVRPLPGAPVSAPLRWEEVTEDLDPRAFTIDVVLERIERHGDLAKPLLRGAQRLDRSSAHSKRR